MNITLLSKQLNIESGQMLIKANNLNIKYELGITDFNNITRTQYDIIRASLDTMYLVQLLNGDKRGGKYNYQNAPDYLDLQQWVGDYDLDGCSTKDIRQSLPDYIRSRGHQTIAAAMRTAGYESRVVILDNGKQGRRWFNYIPDVKSIVNTNTKDAEDAIFYEWAKGRDFEGLSSKEVDELSPINRGKLNMASLMRAIGYENRRVYLDKYGKQGRRWFKQVSFL